MTSIILRRHCPQILGHCLRKMELTGIEVGLTGSKYSGRGVPFVTVDRISTWREDNLGEDSLRYWKDIKFEINDEINSKVSIYVGDITVLKLDAIVNAANNSLAGGGGVDGAIHRVGGRELTMECSKLGGCETGSAKISKGYKLPAEHVIHTVGPIGEKPTVLQKCYEYCLHLAKENNFRTIAFPCISTGVYRYPNEKAAHVACKAVREFLDAYGSYISRVVFCCFLQQDVEAYKKVMHLYFPLKPYVK